MVGLQDLARRAVLVNHTRTRREGSVPVVLAEALRPRRLLAGGEDLLGSRRRVRCARRICCVQAWVAPTSDLPEWVLFLLVGRFDRFVPRREHWGFLVGLLHRGDALLEVCDHPTIGLQGGDALLEARNRVFGRRRLVDGGRRRRGRMRTRPRREEPKIRLLGEDVETELLETHRSRLGRQKSPRGPFFGAHRAALSLRRFALEFSALVPEPQHELLRELVDQRARDRRHALSFQFRTERLVHVQGRAPGSPVQKQNFTTFATSPAWRLISAQQLAVRSLRRAPPRRHQI